MKIAANGERNAAMIKVQSENNKTMQEVRVQWEALKNQLSKDQKKGKMDPKLIEDRVEMVTLLGTEIKTLASKNQSYVLSFLCSIMGVCVSCCLYTDGERSEYLHAAILKKYLPLQS